MRVALVLDRFEPARGGVEQWTARYASALVKNGCEVHVAARSFAGPGDADVVDAIKPHVVPASACKTGFAAAAEGVLRSLDVDVIHDMGFGWYADVIQPHGGSRLAACRRNIAMRGPITGPLRALTAAVTPRERAFRGLAKRQFGEPETDRGPKRFVAISKMVRDDLVGDYGIEPSRLDLVYNGIDTRAFTPASRPDLRAAARSELKLGGGTTFLIIAHNLKLKGLPTLLAAFARVIKADPDARLVVAGGRRLWEFRQFAWRLGVGKAVRWIGAVDDVRPLYAAADVYVHPTFYDPCSLVTLEAAAAGLPVLTTRFNGFSELIEPGVEGDVLDRATDAATLAAQMTEMLDRDRRGEASAAARRLALRHTFEQNVAELLAVYRKVCNAAGPSATAA